MEKDLAAKLLDAEWYENVNKAISYAMNNLPEGIDLEKVFNYIIDYNVQRKLHEYIVNHGVETLNRRLDWRNKSFDEAFIEYKDIVDTCDICEKFKSFTFHINFGKKSGRLQNLFLIWKELTNSYYKNLKVFSVQKGNVYKVVIKRWKSN